MKRLLPLLVLLNVVDSLAAGSPPLAERITASPSVNRKTTLRGAAQSVAGGGAVIGVNTHTGHYATATAGADGAFELSIDAFPGDSIFLKSDPTGAVAKTLENTTVIDHAMSQLLPLQGTVIRVPDGLVAPTAFIDSGISNNFLPYWTVQGNVNKLTFAPGESIVIEGVYTVYAQASPGQTPRVNATTTLVALSGPDGRGALDQNTYASTLMTPTGLPIERVWRSQPGQATSVTLDPADGNLRATVRLTLPIPADLPAGYYRPLVVLDSVNVPGGKPEGARVTTFLGNASRRFANAAYLPIVRIGNPAPPRMYWTLLANTLSEGMRGVNAVEDRGRFSIVPRVTTSSDRLVIRRVDPRAGTTLRYNIEPFALTLGLADRGAPINPPVVPLRLPSGQLKATVRAPDGTTTTIGPVPFRQIALAAPSHPMSGAPMENGGHITDPVQLTTLDPRFNIEFAQEGRYSITLEGNVEDVWGTVWNGGGTHEVDVARPLLIESMFIPGTPLIAGDAVVRAVRLIPPVPAEVQIRVRFAPGAQPGQAVDERVALRANRFGYARADSLRFGEPGEYRVDIEATYRDSSGRVWQGTQTFGSAVAPAASPIIAHGKRGTDDQPQGRQQWFSRKQIGIEAGRGHVTFAFQSGDVMWLEDRDSTKPVITIQDPSSVVTPLLRSRYSQMSPYRGIDRLAADGEIPLHSSTAKPFDLHVDPSSTDLWAYGYASVQRPLVRVREEISDGEPPAPYWRFNDLYGNQSGNGFAGDLPNDFKFQFGAAVLRGSALAKPQYAIYGSLFVLVPNDDPLGGTRVFPPFQGNPGPSGGPLFMLKGKAIDLFFHPMTVRPGAIFERNENTAVAGYVAPTLPSRIEMTVTSPSGVARTVRGQANSVGYFHDSSPRLILDEEGVWRARVKVTHDGETSAGQVQPPFPVGDILGSRDGEFYFYVVRSDTPPLDVRLGGAPTSSSAFVRPSEGPLTFTITPPAGLTNMQLTYTTTMPGFVLEEGTTTARSYSYDAQKLARDFPNLDLRTANQSDADIITFTFFLSGTDASGARRSFARQIVLKGEEILAPDQNPSPLPPRRRSAR